MNRINIFLHKHKYIKIALIVIVAVCVIEFASGAMIVAAHYFVGAPKRLSNFRFHPLWTGENILNYARLWNEPFPVYGFQMRLHVSDECGMSTDRHGFIHNGDSNREITTEAFTVFIVGGSTVAGHGSSCNDQTISAHLERILSERYPGVMVVNAGVPGYYSPQEFLKIANEILFYDPEIVISLSGTNDFLHEPTNFHRNKYQYFLNEYHIGLFKTLGQTDSLWWSAKNLLWNIVKPVTHTYVAFVVKYGFRAIVQTQVVTPSLGDIVERVKSGFGIDSASDDDISQIHEDNIETKMSERINSFVRYIKYEDSIVSTSDTRYYFLLQPILFTEARQLPEKEQLASRLSRLGYYRKFGIDVLNRAGFFWDEVDKRMKHNISHYYDFRQVFEDGAEVYSDQIHYNDEGNLIIAARIADLLTEDGALTAMADDPGSEVHSQNDP